MVLLLQLRPSVLGLSGAKQKIQKQKQGGKKEKKIIKALSVPLYFTIHFIFLLAKHLDVSEHGMKCLAVDKGL